MQVNLLRPLGRIARTLGLAIHRAGLALQGSEGYAERLVPSTRVVTHGGKSLQTGYTAYVARSAAVIGDVTLKEGATVWYGTTVRGDRSSVVVGTGSSVLDGVSVSTAAGKVVIGDSVTIAPGSHLDSCVIEDGAMVGMGARVLAGAVVGKDSYIDAGAVVGPGEVVPGGSLWTGNPAKELRKLTVDEMSFLRNQAAVYAELAVEHMKEESKGADDVLEDELVVEFKRRAGMPLSRPLEDETDEYKAALEYKGMMQMPKDTGLFREVEYDDDGMRAQLQAEAIAADQDEEQFFDHAMRFQKVAALFETLARIPGDRAGEREAYIGELDARDEVAAAYAQDVLRRCLEAEGDEAKQVAMERELAMLDPRKATKHSFSASEERVALAAHAKDAGMLADGEGAAGASQIPASSSSGAAAEEARQ